MTTVPDTPLPRLLRISWRILAICAAFVILQVVVPGSASAHAQLESTSPVIDSTVQTSPAEVTLTFDENVGLDLGGVKVYGPSGNRVDDGAARAVDRRVSVGVDSDVRGSYAVSWRVVSADGHPIRGAFLYHVGEQSSGTAALDRARAESATSASFEVAFGVTRGIYLLGILIAAGGVIVSVWIAPGLGTRWIPAACMVVIAATAVGFVLEAAIAGGFGFWEALREDVLRSQAGTVYGRTALLRGAAALVLWVLMTIRRRIDHLLMSHAAAGAAVVLACVQSLGGHAVAADPAWLRVALDMLHIVAASIWIGGLVQIAGRRANAIPTVSQVRRYSRAALVSVIVLVVTGLYAAWDEIGLSWSGLIGTTYGRLIVCKSLLLVATIPLANRNRVRHMPGIATTPITSWSLLRRYVRNELALLALVIAATAWLVQTPPPQTRSPARGATPASSFVEERLPLPSGGEVEVIIAPAQVGTNHVHLSAFDAEGRPDGRVTAMTVAAALSHPDIGPLEAAAAEAGTGHFIVQALQLPYAGTWELSLRVEHGRFSEERTRFQTRITPPTSK